MLSIVKTIWRASLHWHKETLETLQLNIVEFLQEETRDLPCTPEIEIFYDCLQQLHCDAKQLEKKIEQLEMVNK